MSRRIEKVSALLKREVSVLIRETIPEEFGIVSVVDVEVTADFKDAKVYISVMEQKRLPEILGFLDETIPEFQRALGKKLKMKFTPKLHFLPDNYQEKIDNVEKLLKEIHHGT